MKSTIVDRWGRPFEGDLETPQTEAEARLAQLHRHFGGHPSSGLTPAKAANILKEAEQGNLIAQCELAEDMEEKSAHIQSELGKRRLSLLSVPWNILPPPNASAAEKRDTEMLEELLRTAVWLRDAIFDASDAILKGYSNQELTWEYIEKQHVITSCEFRDPSWFQINPDKRNQLMLRDGSHNGMELRPFGWLSHTAKAKSGYLERRGLVRVLVWPFLFANYSVRDLAEFLEIYGLPIRLGKYPAGASEREKLTLLRAVMSIGHNAGGIIPKGMEIDFQNAADGQSDPFMAMIAWCEKSVSKAVLGGTLTTQADGASSTNALGNIHNEVRYEIRDADLAALEQTLTRDIIYPLYALNGKSFRDYRRHPRFQFDTSEGEDYTKIADPLKTLVSVGAQIPVAWLHEKTKIPMADGKEPVLQIAERLPGFTGLTGIAALRGNATAAFADQMALEQALDKLSTGQFDEQMLGLLKPVFDAAEQGPEAMAQQLEQLWPGMDDSLLTQRLAQVLFVGELWGQLNANT
ncbi:DUF935 domain-containing protein [Alkalimonas mucilaginosa]|uniref:DUF935 domain-containing protein n=1 Tax=Alkalimonas mucilaginosa TaxID=3057676 RepID=A0ABU7JH65_9GAMM|nr:DUF935 domain-containing protein [Alkalimonas sp. MEB004]MEE2025039.1 DUF935 domain-containing protein [Alkalimonas sp. MEB004]